MANIVSSRLTSYGVVVCIPSISIFSRTALFVSSSKNCTISG